MLSVDKLSRTPIYQQLNDGIEREILSGLLPSGAKLPSVRELSVKLCINPNTVQKALAELDSAGIIVSAHGRGCFVADDAKKRVLDRYRDKLEELKTLATFLVNSGFDGDMIKAAVEEAIVQTKKEEAI